MNVRSIAASCLIAAVTAIKLELQTTALHEGEGQEGAGRPWKDNTMHWCRAKELSDLAANAILRGIEQYGKALPGCITFIEVPEENGKCVIANRASVYMQSLNDGCWSYMGMISDTNTQKLNIGPGCDSAGTVLHEIAHALGQAHEQSRSDRDESIKVNMDNVTASGMGQFNKNAQSYVKMPYDYASIMQYSAWAFGKDSSIPVVKPINCEPNCPSLKAMGSKTGFTLLDQKQASDMYHCTKKQNAIRTETIECIDWVEFPQKTMLDCPAYIAAGKCETNGIPCCGCKKWNSGISQRKWVTRKSVAECKDRHQASVCKKAKEIGMCGFGFIKNHCESTCEVCQNGGAEIAEQDFADDMTNREVVSMAGGKNFVGTVGPAPAGTTKKVPNGKGVFTWGNLVRHVGTFENGLPKAGTAMSRFNKDGSVFYGTVTSAWMNTDGLMVPPLALSKDASYKGTFNASGDLMSGGKLVWPEGKSYSGPLVKGLPQGEGSFTWSGHTYTGTWSAGMPQGAGTVKFAGGETFEASWQAGKGTGKFCNTASPSLCGDWTLKLF